jgi:hypothetical protein
MAETVTIYVPLLDEGTSVWRPASAERLGDNTFRITGPMPDNETWAFGPGSRVTAAHQSFADGTSRLVATSEVT